MKTLMKRASSLRFLQVLSMLILAVGTHAARAQAFCASDGQPQPVALLERFINSDCESCWKDPATAKALPGQAVLDWIVPGGKGDDAPLSAVASRDGLSRLEALGQVVPKEASNSLRKVKGLKGSRLRVAHGLVLSGYVGVSIGFKPLPARTKSQAWSAWLALVESLPEGTEGTPVARNLVRNALQLNGDGRSQLSKKERSHFFESRVMSVAQGVNPDRLRVIGWLEDASGQVLTAAQSRCAPMAGQGR
ncbi:MAG: hypothetical protein V4646_10125 [Pseudomonadota bacterium]